MTKHQTSIEARQSGDICWLGGRPLLLVATLSGGSLGVDSQEEVGTLHQQPLALGYYVSTAPTGRMPRWFWASCPHLENVCPAFLKNSLHLHSPAIQQNSDDLLQQQSTVTVHPLDSQYTTDVLSIGLVAISIGLVAVPSLSSIGLVAVPSSSIGLVSVPSLSSIGLVAVPSLSSIGIVAVPSLSSIELVTVPSSSIGLVAVPLSCIGLVAIYRTVDYFLTVPRYVLEGYNALSWLALDSNTRDRLSCLPVHIQALMQLYHMTSALV
uniref:Mediator of RNA polymerase II transcription subunit 13 n=1 Tax=Timema bartmani TaxID=61472 RepID=A0A7R9F284_9NEOP|nr:unnamed protein product [Timema bartmani]